MWVLTPLTLVWRSLFYVLVGPLQSRKVQAAMNTLAQCYLVQLLPMCDSSWVAAIAAMGVARILGIAIEDHGAKSCAAAWEPQ